MATNVGPCVGGPLDRQVLTSDDTRVAVRVHVDLAEVFIPQLSANFANVPASSTVVYQFYNGVWVYQ
jgi:hypothetical protein